MARHQYSCITLNPSEVPAMGKPQCGDVTIAFLGFMRSCQHGYMTPTFSKQQLQKKMPS